MRRFWRWVRSHLVVLSTPDIAKSRQVDEKGVVVGFRWSFNWWRKS